MSFRNKSVSVHNFAMIPKADIPRSSFRMQKAYKTTFGGISAGGGAVEGAASLLYPVFVEEVLPGDTFNLKMTAFARLATPLFPVMDNLYLDTFFFFCPNRLVWDNWQRFMGERDPDPDSSIDYQIPQMVSPAGGWAAHSIYDYMGLPLAGQIDPARTLSVNALPLRMYYLIWNQWFRDENLFDSVTVSKDNGPDDEYFLQPRMKRHDYFTGCLPWPQKGDAVSIPLGTYAPVISTEGLTTDFSNDLGQVAMRAKTGTIERGLSTTNAQGTISYSGNMDATSYAVWAADTGLATDLSEATAATINQLRESFQIQRLLERDARGGSRYTEIIRSHFGVISPDARLQRPEYLGGGSSPVHISPVAQTSATAIDGSDTPQGNLSAIGTSVLQNHGFTQSFTEHGYIIGLVNIRADLTYQQGLRRHWSRSTRYDYYFPVFAHLGEQAVLSKEIYCTGEGDDDLVFGYQERWAEYRYLPSEITGQFRSTYGGGTLDAWHYAQDFSVRPSLNSAFIQDAPPLKRNIAVGATANGSQFLFDAFFDVKAARPMPMYSVPGLIDHF